MWRLNWLYLTETKKMSSCSTGMRQKRSCSASIWVALADRGLPSSSCISEYISKEMYLSENCQRVLMCPSGVKVGIANKLCKMQMSQYQPQKWPIRYSDWKKRFYFWGSRKDCHRWLGSNFECLSFYNKWQMILKQEESFWPELYWDSFAFMWGFFKLSPSDVTLHSMDLQAKSFAREKFCLHSAWSEDQQEDLAMYFCTCWLLWNKFLSHWTRIYGSMPNQDMYCLQMDSIEIFLLSSSIFS